MKVAPTDRRVEKYVARCGPAGGQADDRLTASACKRRLGTKSKPRQSHFRELRYNPRMNEREGGRPATRSQTPKKCKEAIVERFQELLRRAERTGTASPEISAFVKLARERNITVETARRYYGRALKLLAGKE
jgi:hypothetical protein